MFLIIVDAHSKWLEVVERNTTTAVQMIVELQKVFFVHGILEQVVSDNGPQFSSSEFGQFCKVNEVKHMSLHTTQPLMGLLNRSFKPSESHGEMSEGWPVIGS